MVEHKPALRHDRTHFPVVAIPRLVAGLQNILDLHRHCNPDCSNLGSQGESRQVELPCCCCHSMAECQYTGPARGLVASCRLPNQCP